VYVVKRRVIFCQFTGFCYEPLGDFEDPSGNTRVICVFWLFLMYFRCLKISGGALAMRDTMMVVNWY